MRVLVTGGTGFVGRHVVNRLLDENHEVRIFSRKKGIPDVFLGREVAVSRGDLEDPLSLIAALDGVDVFYHIGEIKNTSKAAAARNIRLMEAVIGHMSAQHVRRIVFVSSISVSGVPSEIPADEDTPAEIVLSDHYTDCKRQCEKLLQRNAGAFEYVIARPAPVYGPGSRYLGRLINLIERIGPIGLPWIGNARNLVPLIQVNDLADALCRAGTAAPAAGKILIMSDGLRHSWLDFFGAIADCIGKSLRLVPVPPLLLKISALPLDLFAGFFGMNLDPVSYVTYFSRDLYFDTVQARTVLSWQPRYTLQQGIRDMVSSYRKG